jgi:tetratricopeptide (TPR) repeat protein
MTPHSTNLQTTPQNVNPQFIESIHAGLQYWQQKTREMEPGQIQWLDRRRRNLFQAVLFGLQTRKTWQATITVLLQSFNFVEWGGYGQEWIPILEQALASAPEKVSVLYGRLQNRLGQLYRLSQKYPESMAQHEQALLLAQKLADKALEIAAYSALCELYLALNKINKAEENGNLALNIAQKTGGSERSQAFLYQNMGHIAQYLGNWEQAVARQQQAVCLWREQADQVYLARSLNDLGNSYINVGDFPAAQHAFEEASTILQGTINESDKAKVYLNLGVLFYRQEKWVAAKETFLQINPTLLRERNNQPLLATLHNNLGNVCLKLSQWEESTAHLKEAIKLFRTLNDRLNLANSLGTLGEVLKRIGNLSEAAACYQEALQLLEKFSDNLWANQLYQDFADVLHQIQAE